MTIEPGKGLFGLAKALAAWPRPSGRAWVTETMWIYVLRRFVRVGADRW